MGSANSDTDRTNSESSIKAWIAADYLRVAQAEGRDITSSERADIAAMVRSSDNAAAQRLYQAMGGDAILRHLRLGLRRDRRDLDAGVLVAHPDHRRRRHPDLRLRPAQRDGLPGWERSPDRPAQRRPEDAFGITAALPPTTTVSMKNGWMPHATTGQWNVNCVAAWDDYVLAVLTRYPVGRSLAYGADVCRDVTATLVDRLR